MILLNRIELRDDLAQSFISSLPVPISERLAEELANIAMRKFELIFLRAELYDGFFEASAECCEELEQIRFRYGQIKQAIGSLIEASEQIEKRMPPKAWRIVEGVTG